MHTNVNLVEAECFRDSGAKGSHDQDDHLSQVTTNQYQQVHATGRSDVSTT